MQKSRFGADIRAIGVHEGVKWVHEGVKIALILITASPKCLLSTSIRPEIV